MDDDEEEDEQCYWFANELNALATCGRADILSLFKRLFLLLFDLFVWGRKRSKMGNPMQLV